MSPFNTFSYNSDLIGGSLMVRESRIVAELLLADASPEDWQHAIVDENRLQKRSQATALRNARTVRIRLEQLHRDYWQALIRADDELATQITFCALLAQSLLLVEFIETVVNDALLTRNLKLEPYQWQEFLDERSQRDPRISEWTESSRKKMGQVVFRSMEQVGLIDNTRSRTLQRVLLRTELSGLLAEHPHPWLQRSLPIITSQGI